MERSYANSQTEVSEMSSLKELVSVTDELNRLLDQMTASNRLELLEKIDEVLNKRQALFDQLDFSSIKNEPVIKQLLSDEQLIKSKMQQIFHNIKNDLRMINKKRASGESYINPYQSLQVDGVFFDQKK